MEHMPVHQMFGYRLRLRSGFVLGFTAAFK
jgi:hypothetical protein